MHFLSELNGYLIKSLGIKLSLSYLAWPPSAFLINCINANSVTFPSAG